ncbi:pyridine nucleotide-disulfide oxidoreductase domain-containing protein [Trichoderma breve]|uniref:Pyridine nucleotide-disulfide oxidoreductase domain-containing protein n=1 Tax=Trichoderma breve TaxID=2034170 RepID=A0A9W9E3X9_9HYPO|nr:pyridine nucleotide-disulfide oxidoreductase domain-containing protein [Trichoderma breve]KAJ4856310.1 pyridine nucleotide-disulfide oxidoreductase domain-containing protein [Trichoderma breve]
MTKTIVILGVGVAAAPLIRQTMRNVVLKEKDYNMIVVAPNTHFHWPIAMPRVVVPGQLADDKAMIDLRPFFKEYPADKFEFVQGVASAMDPASNTVDVLLSSGASRTINYHTLVVATGTSSKDNMPWKAMGDTEHTKSRLREVQEQIKNAKSIVIAGGGQTGSETAGELGFEYSKEGRKEVYFIYNDSLPLAPPVMDSVRKQTKTELEKLKVKLVPNTKVTAVEYSGNDTILTLTSSDGKTRTLTTQAYLPTTGGTPNSSFVPASLLDSEGYINQTASLQAKGYDNIFVIGDIGNLEGSKAGVADAQTVHLIKALPIYLKGGAMPVYTPSTKVMVGITLGRSRGTGQMGSFKVFSFLIHYAKGRFLGTDYAHLIAAGKKTLMTTYEK